MSPVTPSALCGTLQAFPTISAPQRNKSTQGKRWLASISLNSTELATDMKKCEISSQKITNYRRHVLYSLRLSLNLLPDDNGNIVSLPPGFLLVSSLHQRRLVGWVRGKKKSLTYDQVNRHVLWPNNCLVKNSMTQSWVTPGKNKQR